MKYFLKFLFIIPFLVSSCCFVIAQGKWPNPESERLYYKGRDLLSNGKLEEAIRTYQEAISIAPEKMIIQRDLGKAYFFSKNYDAAMAALDNVIRSSEADDQAYQLMADCQQARGEHKHAMNTLSKGIEQFPGSGLLYNHLGKLYEDDGDIKDALDIWLDGIHKAPEYHVNYYEAARTYAGTDRVLWVMLYGEIFVNLEHETPRAAEMRQMIAAAYKRLFSSNPADVAELGSSYKNATAFEQAVYDTYIKYASILNDGMTTENLIILRSRFMMDWSTHFADQFPFSLFSYYDEMMRNGDFDLYNQWIFGKAINEQEFNTWLKNNSKAFEDFKKFREGHLLKPQSSDFYNDKELKHLFSKKRR